MVSECNNNKSYRVDSNNQMSIKLSQPTEAANNSEVLLKLFTCRRTPVSVSLFPQKHSR